MTKIDSLNHKQRRAIRSLLTCPTIETAAVDCGSSESALYRWLREDDFRAALTAAEDDALDAASRRLVHLAEKSINRLEATMDDTLLHPAHRMRAADLLLGHMSRLAELRSIVQRLAALEDRTNATN